MAMKSCVYLALCVLSLVALGRCDHGGEGEGEDAGPPYNILVINVDDLRPSLGSYGVTEVMSPHLDKLAEEGVLFRNAFNQISICGPSRSSFMTSKTPDSLEVWNFKSHIRVAPNGNSLTTIAEYFKNHGYFTGGGGKSFHDEFPPNYDGLRSWSMDKVPYLPISKEQCTNNVTLLRSTIGAPVRPTAVCPIDRPDSTFFEYQLVDRIIEGIEYAGNHSVPFLAWAGFFKPHHPSLMPKRFFDMYNLSQISIPKNYKMNVPEDFSEASLFNYAQGRQADSPMTNFTHTLTYGPNEPLPFDWIRILRAGYFSSITWTDDQVGRLMQQLEERDLRKNTFVILFADNGISMGEGSKYMKSDNWDISCRSPFIITGPGIPKGGVRHTPIELLDVFPTLANLAGLPVAANYSLHGKDITQLIMEGDNDDDMGNFVAFSQFPRCVNVSEVSQPWLVNTFPPVPQPQIQWNCMVTDVQYFVYMGYTVRSRHWRYTEWRKYSGITKTGDWTDAGIVGRELYDHRNNKVFGTSFLEEFETVNVYNKYKNTGFVRKLKQRLEERFNPNYL